MKKEISVKQILVIGIISLLATGIILSSNWSYFIKNNDTNNNALASYQISGNNFYSNYRKNEGSILFQINVLKSAIRRNNFMYKSYSKVFAHNISYIKNQKSSMKNRISIANSSIKHELDILNTMNNIIINHPYNYLKFFQSKNYTLPGIISQSNNNISSSSSINNIETFRSSTNKSNTTISNISYQSEEAAIGIGSISSMISGAKTLIFSKVNFNYNNIYYFSTYTDNLTTLNQFKNTYISSNSQNSAKNNQFIKNNDTNSLNQTTNNLTFSFLHNNIIDYIKNKPYVVAAPLGGLLALVGGVVTGVIIYKVVKRAKAKAEPIDPMLVNSASNDDTVINPKNVAGESAQEQALGDRFEHTRRETRDRFEQVRIETDDIITNARKSRGLPPLDEEIPDSVSTGVLEQGNNNGGVINNREGTGLIKDIIDPGTVQARDLERQARNSEHIKFLQKQGLLGAATGVVNDRESIGISDSRTEPLKVNSSSILDARVNTGDIPVVKEVQPLETPGIKLESNDQQPAGAVATEIRSDASTDPYLYNSHEVRDAFITIVSSTESGVKSQMRVKEISDSEFSSQIRNRFHFMEDVNNTLNRSIDRSNLPSIIDIIQQLMTEKVAMSSAIQIHEENFKTEMLDIILGLSIPVNPAHVKTKNGWFEMPTLRKFEHNLYTQKQKDSLLDELEYFENIVAILSKNAPSEVSSILDSSVSKDAVAANEAVNKLVAKQILADFNEVANAYRTNLLEVENLQVKNDGVESIAYSEGDVHQEFTKNTKLIEKDFDDVQHIGLNDENINYFMTEAQKVAEVL